MRILLTATALLAVAAPASGADRLRTASATDKAAMMRADTVLTGH